MVGHEAFMKKEQVDKTWVPAEILANIEEIAIYITQIERNSINYQILNYQN